MARIVLGLAAVLASVAACETDGAVSTSFDGDAPFARATALAASQAEIGGRISVAQFDGEGRLIYPENIAEWVHLGSSVGLNYAEGTEFDPANPGIMNVVTMEPTAYRYFMETGRFADGTMFHLTFHSTVRDERLNSAGFATGPAAATEIHYKDSEMFPDGFNFFNYRPGQTEAAAVPLPNACVSCHTANADHDGVFVQFYPAILERLGQATAEREVAD
jgi:hypothetical protein